MSTIAPGLGLLAGLSTSVWKIHGWFERQALRRRTTGRASLIAPFYAAGAAALASRRIVAIAACMHLSMPATPTDPRAQAAADRKRLQRALNASLAFVLLLT